MSTPSANKFNHVVESIAEGKYNTATNQFAVALCAAANAPTAGMVALTELTQISYTNLSSRNITTTSSSQTSGTWSLVLQDLVLTASGTVADFRYIVLIDTTATNFELLAWWDHGATVSMTSGQTFTIDFNASGAWTSS